VRLLFLNERLDYASGSTYSLDLARALQAQGEAVRVCTTGGPLHDAFRKSRIETYVAKFNFFSYRKLLQYLREFNPDLIHIQNQRSVAFGRKISQKLRVPHIVTVHRPPSPSLGLGSHPLPAGVIAVNEVIREHLVNDQGIPKSLIRVVKPGVALDALRPDPAPATKPAPAGVLPVVGCVGRLSRIKGQHVFLRAARKVLDLGGEAVFAIVGEGEEEAALRKLCREMQLEHDVTFLPYIPGRRELYRIFDTVVVPNLSGGVGTAALEAMAMAKPVIAIAAGEVLHLIHDGKNGLLVPESDSDALADAILRLLRDPELRARLGTDARTDVSENFALAPMVKATLQFYEEVLSQLSERVQV